LIENGLEEIILSYVEKKATQPIKKYVAKNLERFQSPKWNNIVALVGSFDQQWQVQFEKLKVDYPERIDAIDSVVSTRHSIAHGGTAGITFLTIKTYYDSVKKALDKFEEICR
jgi:hypothetical protein